MINILLGDRPYWTCSGGGEIKANVNRDSYLFFTVGEILVVEFGSSLHLPTEVFILGTYRFPKRHCHQRFVGLSCLLVSFRRVRFVVPRLSTLVFAENTK